MILLPEDDQSPHACPDFCRLRSSMSIWGDVTTRKKKREAKGKLTSGYGFIVNSANIFTFTPENGVYFEGFEVALTTPLMCNSSIPFYLNFL